MGLPRDAWKWGNIPVLPVAVLGLAVAASALVGSGRTSAPAEEGGVSANEDLMREHGVLRRVLLAYDEIRDRVAAGRPVDPKVVGRAARLVRRFVEDYHEKLEEDRVFPLLEKAGKLRDLTATLRAQHDAGRRLTDRILALSDTPLVAADDRTKLADDLRLFVRMYRPHAAREDTVLFPALHDILSAKDLDALGDAFEEREREALGKEGFEKAVAEVEEIEKALGIGSLAEFTPR